jgi:hypothetical protein
MPARTLLISSLARRLSFPRQEEAKLAQPLGETQAHELLAAPQWHDLPAMAPETLAQARSLISNQSGDWWNYFISHRCEWAQQPVWGSRSPALDLLPPSKSASLAARPSQLSKRFMEQRASLAADRFHKRARSNSCRPSETELMHTWPFTQFPPAQGHQASANGSLAADFIETLLAPDSTICSPPKTGPTERSYDGVLRYAEAKLSELHSRLAHIGDRLANCTLPQHPSELFVHSNTYDRINTWLANYHKEFCRIAAFSGGDGHPRRFNYSAIEGGKLGLHFGPDEIKPQFRGIPFIIDGKDGPVRPMPWTPPQQNTELNLSEIWNYVLDSWSGDGEPFEDVELAWELTHQGLSLQSSFEAGVHLVPNYQKFWAWLRVAEEKEEAKMNDFSPPSLLGPFLHLPSCPCFLLPCNMATDQLDDDGNIKPRQTANPGKSGDNVPFDGKCAPHSINGLTDLDAMPPIELFNLKSMTHEAASLQCTGERLIQIAEDAESWYEQIGRLCFDTLLTHRWSTIKGIMRDLRLLFGVRGECHQSNRVSFLLRYAGHREALSAQRRREEAGTLPAASLCFIRLRRHIGMSGRLFSSGWFFDDCGSTVTESFEADYIKAQHSILSRFNISMADGRSVPNLRKVKNKRVRATDSQEFNLLGLRSVVEQPGRLTIGTVKRARYGAVGLGLANDILSGQFKAKTLTKWSSQMAYVASVDPDSRVDLQATRSRLRPLRQSSSAPLRVSASLAVRSLTQRLSQDSGIALQALAAPMDGSRRPVMTVTSDAALDLTASFAGYGYWAWEPGSRVILYGLGQWSKFEMTQINDAAALELHTMNMAVEATAAWVNEWWPRPPNNPSGVGPFCWFDLLQVADNQSAAEHIGNREHASGDAERHLVRRRSQLLRNLQVRVQSHPAVRECISVQAADDLSKGHLTEFKQCIRQLFGDDMIFSELPPVSATTRSLSSTIKFVRALR